MKEIVALAIAMPRPICGEQVIYARSDGKVINAFIRESDLMPLIDLSTVDASQSNVEFFGCYVAKQHSVCQRRTIWYQDKASVDMADKSVVVCFCAIGTKTPVQMFFIWRSSSNIISTSQLPDGMTCAVSDMTINFTYTAQQTWVFLTMQFSVSRCVTAVKADYVTVSSDVSSGQYVQINVAAQDGNTYVLTAKQGSIGLWDANQNKFIWEMVTVG